MVRIGRQGSLHVPMALVLLAFGLASLGAWALLHRWRGLAALQLRLDSCVGRTAVRIRDDLTALEKSNRRMKAVRVTLALIPEPHLKAALDTELAAELAFQEGVRLRWDARRAAWLLQRGCDRQNDLVIPLPPFPFVRDPPDSLGPRPSHWNEFEPRTLAVILRHSPRLAQARVGTQKGKDALNGDSWKATWGIGSNLD